MVKAVLLLRVWSTRREFSQRIDAPNTEILNFTEAAKMQ
jgi:hypothetical protein